MPGGSLGPIFSARTMKIGPRLPPGIWGTTARSNTRTSERLLTSASRASSYRCCRLTTTCSASVTARCRRVSSTARGGIFRRFAEAASTRSPSCCSRTRSSAASAPAGPAQPRCVGEAPAGARPAPLVPLLRVAPPLLGECHGARQARLFHRRGRDFPQVRRGGIHALAELLLAPPQLGRERPRQRGNRLSLERCHLRRQTPHRRAGVGGVRARRAQGRLLPREGAQRPRQLR